MGFVTPPGCKPSLFNVLATALCTGGRNLHKYYPCLYRVPVLLFGDSTDGNVQGSKSFLGQSEVENGQDHGPSPRWLWDPVSFLFVWDGPVPPGPVHKGEEIHHDPRDE